MNFFLINMRWSSLSLLARFSTSLCLYSLGLSWSNEETRASAKSLCWLSFSVTYMKGEAELQNKMRQWRSKMTIIFPHLIYVTQLHPVPQPKSYRYNHIINTLNERSLAPKELIRLIIFALWSLPSPHNTEGGRANTAMRGWLVREWATQSLGHKKCSMAPDVLPPLCVVSHVQQ